jgi:hypothetical protein
MPRCRMCNFQQLPEGGAYCFYNVDPNALGQDVVEFFTPQGYKFESGGPYQAQWGKGSNVARALIGALAERYLFTVTIQPQPPYTWLTIVKGMTGMMGGVIGYAKMNTEMGRVVAAAYNYWR